MINKALNWWRNLGSPKTSSAMVEKDTLVFSKSPKKDTYIQGCEEELVGYEVELACIMERGYGDLRSAFFQYNSDQFERAIRLKKKIAVLKKKIENAQ